MITSLLENDFCFIFEFLRQSSLAVIRSRRCENRREWIITTSLVLKILFSVFIILILIELFLSFQNLSNLHIKLMVVLFNATTTSSA